MLLTIRVLIVATAHPAWRGETGDLHGDARFAGKEMRSDGPGESAAAA
jgi:hypothetical protein